MKKIFVLIIIFTLLLQGCTRQKDSIIPTADNIVIGYGVSSHAMFGAEQSVIDELWESFSSLTFEKTSDEIDLMSAFIVSFSSEGKSIGRYFVDKKCVFWLNGDTQCYKISSGSFDYEYLKKIYENSKKQ